MIGSILEGKYEIQKKIGTGGFGTVYRGLDLKLRRQVAIKILNATADTESFRERFHREAEALARLNHPHIMTVFDCGEHEDRPYLVMELINGPSLEKLMTRATLQLEQVYSLALQICRAMEYAHS
ncbi:MAG: serine/threonine protein kinase, partial [Candidatus Krumholzibacteriota bacterium]|nr:serine/threonine protein kinase [Candidatus Krumholzibacteriota bacterium]